MEVVEKAREGYHVDVADVRLPYGRLCILCCARTEFCGNETLEEAVEEASTKIEDSTGRFVTEDPRGKSTEPSTLHPPTSVDPSAASTKASSIYSRGLIYGSTGSFHTEGNFHGRKMERSLHGSIWSFHFFHSLPWEFPCLLPLRPYIPTGSSTAPWNILRE